MAPQSPADKRGAMGGRRRAVVQVPFFDAFRFAWALGRAQLPSHSFHGQTSLLARAAARRRASEVWPPRPELGE